MWTDYFNKIFLINLKRRPEKLARSKEELDKYNIPYQVVEAKELPDGRAGLFYTIKALIFRHCLELQNMLIFEDDIKFLRDPGPTMDQCVQQLRQRPWDLFYLGVNTHHPFSPFVSPNLLPVTHGFSTHAIAYSPSGQQKVNGFRWQGTPVDVMLSDKVQSVGKSFCCYPMLATQRNGYSDIDQKEVTYDYIEERFNNHVQHLL
jgi:GR25 family glycosyltransferase involved in LPS biosynthesis